MTSMSKSKKVMIAVLIIVIVAGIILGLLLFPNSPLSLVANGTWVDDYNNRTLEISGGKGLIIYDGGSQEVTIDRMKHRIISKEGSDTYTGTYTIINKTLSIEWDDLEGESDTYRKKE